MTTQETAKIMAVLRVAYPGYYRNVSQSEAKTAVALWERLFHSEPYEHVLAAVETLIADDTKGFPPVIGQVKEKLRLLYGERGMTEQEAWQRVAKALRNGTYGSVEEFDRLPDDLKRLVGSPNQLREWAMMDTETVHTVVASNFQRSYRALSERQRQLDAIPETVRDALAPVAERLSLEGGSL